MASSMILRKQKMKQGRQIGRSIRAAMESFERRILMTALAPTWNATGTQNQPFPNNTGETNRVQVSGLGQFSDGKVAELIKQFHDFEPETYALVRHNADGTVDKTFGTNGVMALGGTPTNILVTPDDHMLVSYYSGKGVRLLAGYKEDGTLDRAFATDGGYTVPPVGNPIGLSPFDFLVRGDGKIVLSEAGFDVVNEQGTSVTTEVIRLNATGSPDTNFGGGDGIVTYTSGFSLATFPQIAANVVIMIG